MTGLKKRRLQLVLLERESPDGRDIYTLSLCECSLLVVLPPFGESSACPMHSPVQSISVW